MLPAGELRHRVSVEVKSKVSDGHDGYLPDQWAPVQARLAARVKPLAGRDLERARQIDPRISHEVTLRYWKSYRNDVNGGRSRLVYHEVTNRVFEIVAPPVDVEERHVQLTLLCRELV